MRDNTRLSYELSGSVARHEETWNIITHEVDPICVYKDSRISHSLGSRLYDQLNKRKWDLMVAGSCIWILDSEGSQWSTSGHHGLVQSFQAKKIEGCLKLRVNQHYWDSRMSGNLEEYINCFALRVLEKWITFFLVSIVCSFEHSLNVFETLNCGEEKPPTSGFVETDIMNKTSNVDSKAETIDDPFRFSVVSKYSTKHHNTSPTRAEHCGSYPKISITRDWVLFPISQVKGLMTLTWINYQLTFATQLFVLSHFFSRNKEITASKVNCDA